MRFQFLFVYMISLGIGLSNNAAYAIQDKESGLTTRISAEYTTGDYGTAGSTEIWYFPFSISRLANRTYIELTIPYISVTGTGEIIPSIAGHRIMQTQTSTTRQTESGLGDIMFYASYDIITETASRPRIELGVEAKFGTADETKNLGTGENDYAAEINIIKNLDTSAYFGGVGYRVLGEPTGVEFDNVVYGYIGMEYHQSSESSVGVELDVAQKATPNDVQKEEVILYLKKRVSQTTRVRPYAIIGLSDGSPDWGVGLTISASH